MNKNILLILTGLFIANICSAINITIKNDTKQIWQAQIADNGRFVAKGAINPQSQWSQAINTKSQKPLIIQLGSNITYIKMDRPHRLMFQKEISSSGDTLITIKETNKPSNTTRPSIKEKVTTRDGIFYYIE
ncbi:MAG: hypothetical protein SZ59_C0002G0154 [candidate division TM6 bacterium GW2011_GWF2_28_16]|nr:MAG: hypothetical protein SZ59_C0002G0154 [candidate division TM6 bacterium GW2011_GWF2_28_16]